MRITAELLMLIGGATAFCITLFWIRQRALLERYAMVWLAIAGFFLAIGAFPDLVKHFARIAHLSLPAAMMMPVVALIYLFAFSVSLTLSRLHRSNIRLTQELALMELRLRELEARQPAAAPVSTAAAPPGKAPAPVAP